MTDTQKRAPSGFAAVSRSFEKAHPELSCPLYYKGPLFKPAAEEEPLEYIAVYDARSHFHFLTFGFSDIYEKENDDPEYSGFGFELTLLLKKYGLKDAGLEKLCIAAIMQALGRETFANGHIFGAYEYIYTGQAEGCDADGVSLITGFITVPEYPPHVQTPNGKVDLIRLVGATDPELKAVINQTITIENLLDRLGHTHTDYSRKSLF